MTSSELSRTPLHALALRQGARLTAFSGWEMPVQFAGLKQEHEAVRTSAGMFDISHMGKFALEGKALIEALQPLVPSDLARLQPGQAQYTVLLDREGGILDDIIFYRQGDRADGGQQGLLIVNAATRFKDKHWLESHLNAPSATLTDLSDENVLIAVQGPQATAKLQTLVAEDLSAIPAFGHLEATILGQPGFLARTGYTGEDGFEVMVAPEVGVALWEALLEEGVAPCGLGARDTLRLEAALALYGQDIDETTTPLEAGLGWLVHWPDKGDFIGRSRLVQQKAAGPTRRLVGLEMEGRYIARHGYPVLVEGIVVGEVTSGTLSPTLGKAIALAYLPASSSKIGQAVEVEIRGKLHPAKVVKKPFYRSLHRGQK